MSDRGKTEGYDHDEAELMAQQGKSAAPGAGGEAGQGEGAEGAQGSGESGGEESGGEESDEDGPRYDDGGSPHTTDGQIRPEGVAPGDGMGRGYSSLGPGPEGELHAQGHEGGKAHTPAGEDNPALKDGSRSGRDLGGPSIAPEDLDDAPDTTGGAKGDIRTKGMDPHE
jgi:hypothetical protein